MTPIKVREEALVRQLKEKEAVANKAIVAFNALRAECATLLSTAAAAAFDNESEELSALQSKLKAMSRK